jgi:hypothetical protein
MLASSEQSTLEIAIDYIRRGWPVVPIAPRSKAPKLLNWPSLRITEDEAPGYFAHPGNIGVILGNGLVDVDLDCAEAIDFAPEILKPTPAVFGRKSKPESHWVYSVESGCPTEKLTDPLTGKTIVELRGDGGLQTVFPGSVHPSGEPIEWFDDEAFGDRVPAVVETERLRREVRKLAAYSLVKRYHKGDGDLTDDKYFEGALKTIDHRVVERVQIWLGSLPSANGALSAHLNDSTLILGPLPDHLKDKARPAISDQLDASLKATWSPAEQARLEAALTAIDVKSCGYDDFLKIGFALHSLNWDRADGTSIGFDLWDRWCSLSDHYDQAGLEAKWLSFGRSSRSSVTIGTVFHMAKERGWRPDAPTSLSSTTNIGPAIRSELTAQSEARETPFLNEGVSLNDFYAYMPTHTYIFTPSRALWPSSSVNSRVGAIPLFNPDRTPTLDKKTGKQQTITAHLWLDRNRPVEQMTWAPGLPMLIQNRLVSEGGWLEREGVACFNLYRPPNMELGNAAEARRWLDHVHKVYGESADHIVNWLAHRVQYPGVKINHALVLGGNQGIGKDTLLEPAKHAVGPWNFSEVSPQQLLGRFNGFLKSVILRVSEARDLGETNRYSFYDHMKAYTAAPPDVLRVDEKFLNEHSILNCVGVIVTTNHKTDGIYLPADDRRHYVAWSELSKDDFTPAYWSQLWGWYHCGGNGHVAAYLAELDISGFDAKAPPPKTNAFWEIVDASRAPEEAELADVLDQLGNPDASTLDQLSTKAIGDFRMWITDRKNRRSIPHRLEKCGYIPVRNSGAQDGLWVINGRRQVVYAKKDLPLSAQLKAAELLKSASQQTTGRNS